MSTPSTSVTFLLDKSGSMISRRPATIKAFNAYLDELRKEPDGIEFSLIQFDTMSTVTTVKRKPIAEAPALSNANYEPMGGTPLIDAAYKTIKAVEKSIENMTPPPKVVICIQTDGDENASVEHDWNALNLLIKERTAAGWQFVFMGCGLDAYAQGAKMGVAAAQTMSYNSNPETTREAFASTARNTRSYAVGQSVDMGYSVSDRMASGEASVINRGTPQSNPHANLSVGFVPHPAPPLRSPSAPRNTCKPIVDEIDLT